MKAVIPMRRLFVLVLSLVATGVGNASGQEGTRAVYVDGGAAVNNSTGVTGTSVHDYLVVPGGTTLGWKATIGVFVVPWVSVEADLLRTGAMSATESDHYGYQSLEERRDTLFGGVVRIHTTPRKRADLEAAFGVHVVRTSAWSTDLRAPSDTFAPSIDGKRYEMSPSTARTISLGAALRIGGPRLAVVPAFRWDHRFGQDFYNHWPDGGWGRMLTASVSLRATL